MKEILTIAACFACVYLFMEFTDSKAREQILQEKIETLQIQQEAFKDGVVYSK